jgi:hypothetical protein
MVHYRVQSGVAVIRLVKSTLSAPVRAGLLGSLSQAWKDKAKRFKLRVLPKSDNSFEIRQIEEIPITPRNQDGMPVKEGEKAK